MKGVQEVLEAEKDVEHMLQKAQEDKAKIIAQARHKALQLLTQEQKKIDDVQEAQIQKKKLEITKDQQRILDKGHEQLEKLRQNASKNMKKAVDYLLQEVERRIR